MRLIDRIREGQTIALREGSPEFHYFVARGELEIDHNPAHGFAHLADLLFFDPGNEDFLAMVDRYLEKAPVSTLLPEDGEQRYFATEALRALLLARDGELERAASLWTNVHRAKGGCTYLQTWGLDAFEPPGKIEALSAPAGLLLLGQLLVSVPEQRYQTAKVRGQTERLGRLALRFAELHRGEPELAMVVPGLLRKSGLFDQALAFVRDAARDGPTWHSAVAEGLILREAGRTHEAHAAFEQALSIDPSDVSARLEAGDMYERCQEWEEALDWYERALEADAEHPWALPSAHWCRSRLAGETPSGSSPHLDALIELMRAGNSRANRLLDHYRPFAGFLPEPTDALANTLRQMDPGAKALSVSLTNVEAPSNRVAFAVAAGYPDDFAFDVGYTHVAQPDPREPVAEVAYTIWKREGEALVPALPPPPESVARAIAELAALPYDRDVLWAAASLVSGTCPDATPEALLACIGHPPLPPAGVSPLRFIPRVHLAVTDALAHHDAGWDALLSVLHGPMDWSTGTAALSMARLADDDGTMALDVHEAFELLESSAPERGPICWQRPLYWCWPRMPHLWDQERDALYEKLDALDA